MVVVVAGEVVAALCGGGGASHAGQPAHDPRGKRGAAERVQLVLGQVEGGLEGAGVEG